MPHGLALRTGARPPYTRRRRTARGGSGCTCCNGVRHQGPPERGGRQRRLRRRSRRPCGAALVIEGPLLMPPCDDDASPGREGGTTPRRPKRPRIHRTRRLTPVAPEAFIERALESEKPPPFRRGRSHEARTPVVSATVPCSDVSQPPVEPSCRADFCTRSGRRGPAPRGIGVRREPPHRGSAAAVGGRVPGGDVPGDGVDAWEGVSLK